ncbi:MAG: dihydrodipicolinate synthase family protein [Bryobacteraceae bacterium]|nr:dihydrodipicolinate synthase family protein [Bryobacteraceae bacterium]
MSNHCTIGGIIPPMLTPFDAQDRIDEKAHRAEVRYLVDIVGVHGLAVCGSTGEGQTLSVEETRDLTAWTTEEVRSRIPVITGIITNSTKSAIERGQAVADLGVAALQITPPHYLFRPSDEAMLRHFATVYEKTGIPVIIYNVVPWSYLSPALLARILREVDGVIGIKQSASDVKTLADLLLLQKEGLIPQDKRILAAVDALLYSCFTLGAHGAISGILAGAPEWSVALWNAVQKGDHVQALELHHQLLRFYNAFYADNRPANLKTALKLQGRDAGLPRPPMPPSTPEQVEKLRQVVETMGCPLATVGR